MASTFRDRNAILSRKEKRRCPRLKKTRSTKPTYASKDSTLDLLCGLVTWWFMVWVSERKCWRALYSDHPRIETSQRIEPPDSRSDFGRGTIVDRKVGAPSMVCRC